MSDGEWIDCGELIALLEQYRFPQSGFNHRWCRDIQGGDNRCLLCHRTDVAIAAAKGGEAGEWFELSWLVGNLAAITVKSIPLPTIGSEGAEQCPVCFLPDMKYPARDYNICPCCGTEFENDDELESYEQLREKWIIGGMKWWFRESPAGWNPARQLAYALAKAPQAAPEGEQPTSEAAKEK